MKENKIFSKQLKTAMENNKITQSLLAKLTNISETTISRYSNGKREPKITELLKIADALNVSCDYLLGRTVKKRKSRLISLSVYDFGEGIAEYKAVNDKNSSIIIQWIIFTPAYKSLYGPDMYTENKEISIKNICEMKMIELEEEEIQTLRNESLKHDKATFKKYKEMNVAE